MVLVNFNLNPETYTLSTLVRLCHQLLPGPRSACLSPGSSEPACTKVACPEVAMPELWSLHERARIIEGII